MSTTLSETSSAMQTWEIKSDWPSTSLGLAWIYDTNVPSAVYGEVKTANEDVMVWRIDCPSESCPSTDFVPQTITNTRSNGAVNGERTEDGTTTFWICDLAPDGTDMPMNDQKPACTATTGEDIERPALAEATSEVDLCFWRKRMVALEITAGMDQMYSQRPYTDPEMDVHEYATRLSKMYKERCPNDPPIKEDAEGIEDEEEEEGESNSIKSAEATPTPEAEEESPMTRTEMTSPMTGTGSGEQSTPTEEDGVGRMSFSKALMLFLAVSTCSASLL